MQKHGLMANNVESKVSCAVCGRTGPWAWTDLHGEAYCMVCGTPHQIVGEETGCNVDPEFIPVIKEYFQETGNPCGLGSFLIARDYKTELAERDKFVEWLKVKHPEWLNKR